LFVATAVLLTLLISRPAVAQSDPFALGVRETEPLTPEQEEAGFVVPKGFRIRLFAAEPDIQKPMNLAFDSRGRLWVSGSNDYPWASKNIPHGGDSIRILEDTDGDGRADKTTVFVDDITIPIGLYPYRDGVIAFSIPNLWFFRDTDGDDRCDTREILLGPFDHTRDTHGLNNALRRGFDGWIYACHGFNNHSKVTGADGNTVDMQSGNTYRFRPDGSRIEQFTWGQVNPFGKTFDPLGDIYTSDCHTKPVTLLIQDGYYESFGKPHDGLGFVPPVMNHLHGSTAIAGISQYTGNRFPEEYRRSLFVGNVMTSRVHRDTLEYTGSSVRVVEQPDFVIAKDPWFRPVDIQCDPDGALYIADFYNRIIGHYEVPLDHPGRDRFRARIWRVDYVGDGVTSVPRRDLSVLSAAELIAAANTENLPTLMRTVDELSDRIGRSSVPELRNSLKGNISVSQRIAALWGLHRLDGLPEEEILTAAASPERDLRIHAMRLLAARRDWTAPLKAAALAGLDDPEGLVQRAAANALAAHPEAQAAPQILERLSAGTGEDHHLRQGLRIALRNQLRDDSQLNRLRGGELSGMQRQLLTDICLAINSTAASAFLLDAVTAQELPIEQLRAACSRIARQVPAEETARLEQVVRTRFADDDSLQLELLNSIADGLRRQGTYDPARLRDWAHALAARFLRETGTAELAWRTVPAVPGQPGPWGLERRNCNDGRNAVMFLSSLPGGERAVSTLRSAGFALPESLSLYVCGHLGFPNQAAIEKNFVRVCLEEVDRELGRALAPRNDVAQKVTFDLKAHTGQRGYLEVVDGINLNAYAWIAVSRIEPAVVSVPATSPAETAQRLQDGCRLAADYRIEALRPVMLELLRRDQADPAVRQAAGRTLAALINSPSLRGLAALLGRPLAPHDQVLLNQGLSDAVDGNAAEAGKSLGGLLRSMPTHLQQDVALELADDSQGADLVLELLESGLLTGRVLQNAQVQQRLLASGTRPTIEKLTKLLEMLPPASVERDEQIAELQRRFVTFSSPSAEEGRKLFETKCAACHQLKGQGKVIGPQLDGIGNRGLQRLLEDVIDPNRNVDVAFRSRTYALDDGKVLTGVFRRDEGAAIVIADNKGEEITIPKGRIEEERTSPVSIMPDNWGTSLTPDELLRMIGFLLEQRK